MAPIWRMRLTVLGLLGSGVVLLPGLYSMLVTGDADIGALIFQGETPGWFEFAGFLLGLPALLKLIAWIESGPVARKRSDAG